MKLITEHTTDVQFLTEGTGDDKKLFIEGIFMQAEKENRNKRIYPKKILEEAVKKYYTEQVSTGRAVGELNHPEGPSINLDKVSHRILDLQWNNTEVIGKAQILKTPMGQIAQGLIEGGVKLGVSSRGMGSVENRSGKTYVKNDFMLATVDIVQDPSCAAAFVDGIMEGVEWVVTSDGRLEQHFEDIRQTIHRTPSKQLAEAQIQAFTNFLTRLKNK